MMDKWMQGLRFVVDNKRVLGMVIGLLFGALVLTVGLLKSLLLLFFVVAGYFIGNLFEDKEDWRDVIDRMIPPKYRD